jgi:hypothetical protein
VFYSQLKNSIARAFSRTKKNGSKLDSSSMNDADNVSLQSDISGPDLSVDYLIFSGHSNSRLVSGNFKSSLEA